MRGQALVLMFSIGSAACGEKTAPARSASVQSEGQAHAPASLPPGEAYLAVPDGRIWYKVSGTGTRTPVILLHGGPGYSSFYLKPFEALGDDRPVVRYDQLGGGKSDRITDTTLFTIAHFVRELDSLRAHLGYTKVHLLGHSWGTILAVEYYRVHPEHVASLTLASAALDIPAWERNAKRLVGTLSDSATPLLKDITAPTLYTVGEFDEADPPTIKRFAQMTPGAQVVVLPGAAHLTPWDARDESIRTVRTFLRAADSSSGKP